MISFRYFIQYTHTHTHTYIYVYILFMNIFSPLKILLLSSLDLKTDPFNFLKRLHFLHIPNNFSLNLQSLYDKWNYDILNIGIPWFGNLFFLEIWWYYLSVCFKIFPYSLWIFSTMFCLLGCFGLQPSRRTFVIKTHLRSNLSFRLW